MSRVLNLRMPKRKVAIWLVGFGLLVRRGQRSLVLRRDDIPAGLRRAVRQGEGNGMHERFSAARSSCTPG
jgi:hypothetical protein